MKPTILVCGDGNFSFSLAAGRLQEEGDKLVLEHLLGMKGPFDWTCTSFDGREELLGKYPECEKILPAIEKCDGFRVKHDVNAWELENSFPKQKFDIVLWNHPHLGTEDFNLHRFLLTHFMDSARGHLNPGGKIILSVLRGQAGRWSVTESAEKLGLVLDVSQTFLPSMYPGYETRRNRTGGSFQNSHTQHHTGDALHSVTLRFEDPKNGSKLSASAAPNVLTPEEDKAMATIPNKKHREKPFVCNECGKAFSKPQGLFTHGRQVHQLKKYGKQWTVDGMQLKCDKCVPNEGERENTYRDEEALWQHKIAMHTIDTAIPHPGMESLAPSEKYEFFPCPVCGMSVSSDPEWGIPAHLESLKPIVGMQLPCGVGTCEKKFIEQRALRQHRNFCRFKAAEESHKNSMCDNSLLFWAVCSAFTVVGLFQMRTA